MQHGSWMLRWLWPDDATTLVTRADAWRRHGPLVVVIGCDSSHAKQSTAPESHQDVRPLWRLDETEWLQERRASRTLRLLGWHGAQVSDFWRQWGLYVLYGNYGPYCEARLASASALVTHPLWLMPCEG